MGVIVKHYIQFEDYLKLSLTDDTANVTLFDVDLELGQYRTPGQLIGALLADREWTKRVLAIVLDVDEAVVTRMVNDKRAIDALMALKLSEGHCQVADERAFFSLGAERPSLGQQAHVTSSH